MVDNGHAIREIIACLVTDDNSSVDRLLAAVSVAKEDNYIIFLSLVGIIASGSFPVT